MIGKTILLADDDTQFLRSWDDYFVLECEMKVITALNPELAYYHLESNPPPDIAILDVNFGSTENGIDILRKIRKDGNKTPVIILSETKDLQYELDCYEIDPSVDWLEKSRYGQVESPGMLVKKIEKQLENFDNNIITLNFQERAIYKFFFAKDGKNATINNSRLDLSVGKIEILKLLLEYQKDGISMKQLLEKRGIDVNESTSDTTQSQITPIRKELKYHQKKKASITIKKSNTRYFTYIDETN